MTQDQDKKTNYILRMTGKAEIEKPLNLSEGYKLNVEGEIVSITEADNYDGSHSKIYKFKPIRAEIETEKGEIIKVKDTRSYSQKLRRMITWLWENNPNDPQDSETAYERTMNFIISDVEFNYRKGLEKRQK